MEAIVQVKVQPLLADAFKPYGTVIEGEDLGYPATEEGRVGIEKLRLRFRPGANRVEQLAIHFSYNQTFIPLTGSMILIVAPAPGNRAQGEAEGPDAYELDYGQVRAFSVQPGQAAFIDKGAWHNVITLDRVCNFINVTRKDPNEGPSPAEELEGKIEGAHAVRDYVEFVDVCKRDNKVIQIEI
jgi:ureidoglycolate hydrolase